MASSAERKLPPTYSALPDYKRDYVKKGVTRADVENQKKGRGLLTCCGMRFWEQDSTKPFESQKISCCDRPSQMIAVVCVSCDRLISGQHSCTSCSKLMCNFCCPEEEVFVCKNCNNDLQEFLPGQAATNKTTLSDTTTVDDSQPAGTKTTKEVESGGPTDDASAVGVKAKFQFALTHDYPIIEPMDISPGDLMVYVNEDGHHFAQLMAYTTGEDVATIRFGIKYDFGFLDVAATQSVPLSALYFPSSREALLLKTSIEYGPPGLTYLKTNSFFRHKSLKKGSQQDLHFMGEVSKLKRYVFL